MGITTLTSSTEIETESHPVCVGALRADDSNAESGMFSMEYRNYSAGVLGRFISRDPIGHSGGLNLYSYTTNPVNYVDPNGLDNYITSSNGGDMAFIAHLLTLGSGIPVEVGERGFVRSSSPGTIVTACSSPYQTPEGRGVVESLLDPNTTQVDGLVSGRNRYATGPNGENWEFNVGASMFGVQKREHGFISSGIRRVFEQNGPLGIATLFHEFEEARVECGMEGNPATLAGFKEAHDAALTVENAILSRLLGVTRTSENLRTGIVDFSFSDGTTAFSLNTRNLNVR